MIFPKVLLLLLTLTILIVNVAADYISAAIQGCRSDICAPKSQNCLNECGVLYTDSLEMKQCSEEKCSPLLTECEGKCKTCVQNKNKCFYELSIWKTTYPWKRRKWKNIYTGCIIRCIKY